MAQVKVFRFSGYNFDTDEVVTSRRWATKEFIEAHKYELLPRTGIRVDESIIDLDGLTPRDYDPGSVIGDGGFPPRVR